MHNKRNTCRVELSAPGKLSEPFAGKHGVELLDISPSGARITTFRAFNIGQIVYLTIEGLGQVTCEVRWVKVGEVGVAFDRTLHAAVVEHLAASNAKRR